MPETHLVEVLCCCDNIELCRIEQYVADVRILVAELDALKAERTNG